MRFLPLFLALALSLTGCHENDGTAPLGGGADPASILTRALLQGTVSLPAGAAVALADLIVDDSLGQASVAGDGAFSLEAFEEAPLFAMASTAQGEILLLGWLGGGRTTMDARSTAEVLLYLYGSLFLVPPEGSEAVLAEVAAAAETGAVEAAIVEALEAGATSLDEVLETMSPVLASAVETLTTPSWRVEPMLIDPIDGRSGIEVSAEGFSSVLITNYYRRRAYAFLDRVGYTPEGGGALVPDAERLHELEISPSAGYSNFFDLFLRLGSGIYTPVRNGPLPAPHRPDDAESTTYRVTVVGLGLSAGDFGSIDDAQALRHSQVVVETLLLDLMVPFLANFGLPKSRKLNERAMESFSAGDFRGIARHIASQFPQIAASAVAGDIAGALGGLATALTSDATIRLLLLAGLEAWYSRFLPGNATAALGKVTMFAEEFTRKITAWADFLGTMADTAVQAVHISRSNNADVWEIQVTNGKVTLMPQRSRILPLEQAQLTAVVQDGAGPDVTFAYQWSTGGTLGKLSDNRGHVDFAFDSSSGFVVYTPEPGAEGTDVVEVKVFEVDGADRRFVGKAHATVEIAARSVMLVERKAAVKPGDGEDFVAHVDPPFDTPKEVYYRWSGTEGFGTFDGPLDTDTPTDTQRYAANTEAREGADTLTVEAFVIENGQPRSLGTATAEIRVEQRPSIVLGTLEVRQTFYEDAAGIERMASCSVVWCPDIEGAVSYTLDAYGPGAFDPMAYGSKIHKTNGQLLTSLPTCFIDTGGGQKFWGLSGGNGSPSLAGKWHTLAMSRFGAFIWEIEVTYGE